MDLFFLKALLHGKLQTTSKFEEELNQIPVRAKRYRQIEKSDELKEFIMLEKQLNTPDFQEKKNVYKKAKVNQDGLRWEETEECKMEQRYLQLKKNEDIIFYRTVDVKPIEHWEQYAMTFEDDFKWNNIKESDWKPGFIYPNSAFKNVHSYTTEKQAYIGGDNVSTSTGALVIKTRKQSVEAPAWDPKKGMCMKQFDYTSDALYTDKVAIEEGSVVQVKCCCRGRLNHGIYLRSKNHVPFISLFDYTGKTWYCGVKSSISHDKNLKTLKGLRSRLYTIFTVSWQKDEIVWFVNNLEVYRTKNLVPKGEKLYLHIYSFIFENDHFASEGELSIDWVRAYKLKK